MAATKTKMTDAERREKKAAAERARRARKKKEATLLADSLEKAGITGNGTLTDEQRARALDAPAGLQGKALQTFILDGKHVRETIEEEREKRGQERSAERRTRASKDPEAASLAAAAMALAPDRKSGISTGDARAFLDILGRKDPVALMGGDLEALRTVAESGERTDQTRPVYAAAKEVGKEARELYGRKVACLALAVVRQRES